MSEVQALYAQKAPLRFVDSAVASRFAEELLVDRNINGKMVSAADQFNALRRLQGFKDTQYLLDPNEVTFVNKTILEQLMWAPKADEICPTISVPAGTLTYQYYKETLIQPPRQTTSFEGGTAVYVNKESSTVELSGWDYDFHLTKPQVDLAGANANLLKLPPLQQQQLQTLSKWLVYYRNWYIFRGTSQPGAEFDTGITGLVNDANLGTPASLGLDADNNLTAAGDVIDGAIKLATYLITNKYEPPFILDMTPGVYTQALKNRNTTTNKTDMALILEHTDLFSKVRMNPFLINSATETNSTGAMACYPRPNPENFGFVEGYPIGAYPMPAKSLGVDFKLLFMGIPVVKRASSIAVKGSQTINTLSA